MRPRRQGKALRAVRKAGLLLATTLSVAGCWVIIGESFSGYEGGFDKPYGADGGAHLIDDCRPNFFVSNVEEYPSRTSGPQTIRAKGEDWEKEVLDTDKDPRCWDAGHPLPYCLLVGSTFTIEPGAYLRVVGSKPLVIMAAGDVALGGYVDVTGGESGSSPGAGHHDHAGSSATVGGGGGNGQAGASACGVAGGAKLPLDAGLVGGGHGGGLLPPHESARCRVGGSGGGAVQFVSMCGEIKFAATVLAHGGGGGVWGTRPEDDASAAADPQCPEGHGGGAGGTVWFQAPRMAVSLSNAVDLRGGGGAGGGCLERPGTWFAGEQNDASAGTWHSGDRGNGSSGGLPRFCFNGGRGGYGGAGGNISAPEPGQGGSTSETKCGGGGGGGGRLVLQVENPDCNPFRHSGVCVVLGQSFVQ